jgi:methenyltetrahydromethanopterin cyclohydrolase
MDDVEYEDDVELDANPVLNEMAWDLVHQSLTATDELRIEPVDVEGGGIVLDFGIEAAGNLAAGLALAEICMAGMGDISIVPGEVAGIGWPQVFVQTDHPVEACLLSQYAGWQIASGKFFGMGSGPMRAAAGKEELFQELEYRESAIAVVGVLESSRTPGPDVINLVAKACSVQPQSVALLVAPTASIAGNLQVVARSVETALHKLHELGFDVTRIESACGHAPLAPVAADDLSGIGRTNDAILYGARVTLWITGDDASVVELGPRIPSSGSACYGQPFLDVFEEAGRDFYKIDKHLFSPAEIVFHNLETGRVHHFGGVNHEIMKRSFGL